MKTWIPYTEVNFSDPEVNQLHVDTRDFHVLVQKEPSEKGLKDLGTLYRYPERFFYTEEEVKNLIDRLFKESGGFRKWRVLWIDCVNDWFKYIRIYRVPPTAEHGNSLIVCTRDNYALDKNKLLTCKVLGDDWE